MIFLYQGGKMNVVWLAYLLGGAIAVMSFVGVLGAIQQKTSVLKVVGTLNILFQSNNS